MVLDEEMVRRKLVKLKQYIDELEICKGLTLPEYKKDIPKKRLAERDIQLIVECASDINCHILVEKGQPPPKDYHSSLAKLTELEIYPEEFAGKITPSAGLRNRLIHEYEEIEDEIVHKNVPVIIKTYKRYVVYVEKYLEVLAERK